MEGTGQSIFCVQERKQFLEIGVVRMGRLQGGRLNQAFRDQLAAEAWDPEQSVAPGVKGVAAQP